MALIPRAAAADRNVPEYQKYNQKGKGALGLPNLSIYHLVQNYVIKSVAVVTLPF